MEDQNIELFEEHGEEQSSNRGSVVVAVAGLAALCGTAYTYWKLRQKGKQLAEEDRVEAEAVEAEVTAEDLEQALNNAQNSSLVSDRERINAMEKTLGELVEGMADLKDALTILRN